jgi:hypothetical protein
MNKIAMTLAGDGNDRDKVDARGISRWVHVDKKNTGSANISYRVPSRELMSAQFKELRTRLD